MRRLVWAGGMVVQRHREVYTDCYFQSGSIHGIFRSLDRAGFPHCNMSDITKAIDEN
jgi:hypothetical protein